MLVFMKKSAEEHDKVAEAVRTVAAENKGKVGISLNRIINIDKYEYPQRLCVQVIVQPLYFLLLN